MKSLFGKISFILLHEKRLLHIVDQPFLIIVI
ncbi:hypothetical protein HBHAL_3735 [Halobacillus halophilus DSM 2266]|uniref:Uncharacterized protein n=1 Tax=Halobacillus halophilus (strain ATCC 35676 / DSM 2266 / JCM 20832 / KCTC 3685 / LMG 17431 / NBRC 102448 / NCIMB 2269) TaxID=866895 RepID=I0JPL0_HALH3|nr:hypothetical protein HBHAL_3735 [Halobacillus halophilus DSM 2266]